MTETEGQIEIKRLELQLSIRNIEVEIRKLELSLAIDLAKVGLRGTLAGAIGGLLFLTFLAWLSASSEMIRPMAAYLCIISATISVTVVFYGAFVFNRSVNVAAKWSANRTLTIATGERPPDAAKPAAGEEVRH